jgi:hypothetical protein
VIKSAKVGKEITVGILNKIGVLADITKILAEHGINIEGIAGYAKDNGKEAEIKLITEDNVRAADALKGSGYQSTKEKEVIIVELENKRGALKDVSAKLAQASIDIKYIYGTTCMGGCPAKIILSTSDNEKALVAFNK